MLYNKYMSHEFAPPDPEVLATEQALIVQVQKGG